MRLPLYEAPPSKIEINGRTYRLNLPFGLVLRYMDLCKDPGLLHISDIHEIALHWFVPKLPFPGEPEATAIIKRIVDEYLYPPRRRLRSQKSAPQTVDFNYDSGHIYAAFMQAYHIDLYTCSNTMPWCKFIALFDALPEDTAICRIMEIRGLEMPKPNGHNADEIQRILDLKTLHALPNSNRQTSGDTWGDLFNVMLKEAENNV